MSVVEDIDLGKKYDGGKIGRREKENKNLLSKSRRRVVSVGA
jgi:hypothetical protein